MPRPENPVPTIAISKSPIAAGSVARGAAGSLAVVIRCPCLVSVALAKSVPAAGRHEGDRRTPGLHPVSIERRPPGAHGVAVALPLVMVAWIAPGQLAHWAGG